MFILNQKIIIGGERWFTPMKDLKPVDGLKLLAFTPFGNSIPDDGFTACNPRATISRHIQSLVC